MLGAPFTHVEGGTSCDAGGRWWKEGRANTQSSRWGCRSPGIQCILHCFQPFPASPCEPEFFWIRVNTFFRVFLKMCGFRIKKHGLHVNSPLTSVVTSPKDNVQNFGESKQWVFLISYLTTHRSESHCCHATVWKWKDYLSFPNWDLTQLHHCQSIGVAWTSCKLLVNRKVLIWLFEFTFASKKNEQILDWTESELIYARPTGTARCYFGN